MIQIEQREILHIEEAAEYLRVSLKTMTRLMASSADIPARKVGRQWKFTREALREWVSRGRSGDYRDMTSSIPPPPPGADRSDSTPVLGSF